MSKSPPDDAGERLHEQSAHPTGRSPAASERSLPLPLGAQPRSVDAIEQRYFEAQQGLEQGYWQRRQARSRTQLLAHVARDAVLLLDAQTLLVLEANPAAIALFEVSVAELIGHPLQPCLAQALRPALDDLLHSAAASGQAAEVRLSRAVAQGAIELSASPVRAGRRRCLVLRGRRTEAQPAALADPLADDAALITDATGRVLWANAPLRALCGAADGASVEGLALADVLGGPPAQWAALLARVAERRVIGLLAMQLRGMGEHAASERPAWLSAAALPDAETEQFGFTLRLAAPAAAGLATAVGV
jgi:PAS domain-containing protein